MRSLLIVLAASVSLCGVQASLPIKKLKSSGGSCSAGGGGANNANKGDEEVADRKAKANEKKTRWAEDVAEVGQYEYVGRAESAEESEALEKMHYAKMAWTDEYDWGIRAMLDEAEDLIVAQPEEAEKKIIKILEEHPTSARGRSVVACVRIARELR